MGNDRTWGRLGKKKGAARTVCGGDATKVYPSGHVTLAVLARELLQGSASHAGPKCRKAWLTGTTGNKSREVFAQFFFIYGYSNNYRPDPLCQNAPTRGCVSSLRSFCYCYRLYLRLASPSTFSSTPSSSRWRILRRNFFWFRKRVAWDCLGGGDGRISGCGKQFHPHEFVPVTPFSTPG